IFLFVIFLFFSQTLRPITQSSHLLCDVCDAVYQVDTFAVNSTCSFCQLGKLARSSASSVTLTNSGGFANATFSPSFTHTAPSTFSPSTSLFPPQSTSSASSNNSNTSTTITTPKPMPQLPVKPATIFNNNTILNSFSSHMNNNFPNNSNSSS